MLFASLVLGIVAAATAPAIVPAPDARQAIIAPLREIGRVRAKSTLCTALSRDGGPAALSAIAFEAELAITQYDFQHFDRSSELSRDRSSRRLEADIRTLAFAVRDGRDELAHLKVVAMSVDDDAHDALVGFVDALDGAKGRQLTLTRHLAERYGAMAEVPTSSLVNRPSDDRSLRNPRDDVRGSVNQRDALVGGRPDDLVEDNIVGPLFSFPQDEGVGSDLQRAVGFAHAIESLGGC